MKEFVAARRRAAAAARQAKRIERRAAKLREREAAAARGEEGGDAGGEAGEAGGAAAARTAADAAAPLHRLEYAAQLEQKQHFVEKALRRLPREMQVAARSDTQRERWRMPWLSQERLNQRHGLPCPVAPVLPAAATHGYRNKCEFTIGRDEDGSVAVGFTLGTVRERKHVVGRADGVPTVSAEMLAAARRAQAVLAESPLPPYDKVSHEGFWRAMLARQSFAHADGPPELLLCVAVQAAGLPEEQVASELARLREAFVAPLDPPVRLSLAVRRGAPPGEYKHAGEPAEAEGVETVLGREYIEETLLGLSFRISPDAFFQVNTLGAESLLTLLRAQCSLGPDSVLLDVCCGTGTIGLGQESDGHREQRAGGCRCGRQRRPQRHHQRRVHLRQGGAGDAAGARAAHSVGARLAGRHRRSSPRRPPPRRGQGAAPLRAAPQPPLRRLPRARVCDQRSQFLPPHVPLLCGRPF
uniref:Uncharacterized protein n=2 Tax=Emiliania huxleyi TaxID=2903 RepID=A0A7S3TS82_EMIHU